MLPVDPERPAFDHGSKKHCSVVTHLDIALGFLFPCSPSLAFLDAWQPFRLGRSTCSFFSDEENGSRTTQGPTHPLVLISPTHWLFPLNGEIYLAKEKTLGTHTYNLRK